MAVLTLLGMLSPPALAQEVKVTIGGLIDNLTNYNQNSNMNSSERNAPRGGITDDDDTEWWSRTRGRWFINAQRGKAKAVLGMEFDLIYGQTGAADNPSGRPDGTSGGFDADNDVRNTLELKHMYVEFPFAGEGSLLPMVPYAGMARVGGQPYKVTYKPFVFASSDFGGLNVDLAITPQAKAQFVYAQFEESSTGFRDGFVRGDDIGLIFAVEVTPEKGLKVKPIYSYQSIQGNTSSNLRPGGGVGGLSNAAARFTHPVTGNLLQENRHTIGVDARWRSGPYWVYPTFFYQFGDRERDNTDGIGPPGLREADLRAWFLDIEAGYRTGPFKVEGRFVYTSGNEATDDLDDEVNYFQMFQSGNAYFIGWGEAHGIGLIDYLTALNGFNNALSLPRRASFDRYGRVIASVRGTYSVTPALSVYGIVTPSWTAEDVATRGTIASSGIVVTPAAAAAADETYLGTDLTAGLKWRFAPGLSFDYVFGVFLPGEAMDIATVPGGLPQDADEVLVTTARVRYVF
ncbi:MAG: hypothetical protein ACE5F5_13285 [Acidimicrobiia bacterium]